MRGNQFEALPSGPPVGHIIRLRLLQPIVQLSNEGFPAGHLLGTNLVDANMVKLAEGSKRYCGPLIDGDE